jgi:hypothetical protein
MKKIRKFLWVSILVGLFCIAGLSQDNSGSQKIENLDITVTPIERSFYLGEIVLVQIEFSNKGKSAIYLPAHIIDNIEILISNNKEKGYKKYIGSGNGFVIDGVFPDVKIEANGSVKKQKDRFCGT